jgi:hypothetical protein
MVANLSTLIKSGHLHYVNKLVVGIPFLNVSQVFREIFVVNPKRRLAGTLKSCYVKGRSQIMGMYIKESSSYLSFVYSIYLYKFTLASILENIVGYKNRLK